MAMGRVSPDPRPTRFRKPFDGLSTVASGIGRPLYPDAITKACTRLDFARVCVMLDYHSTLPKHVIVMSPREDGLETPCRVDVEYEWIPSKCTQCCSLGHSTSTCPANRKPTKPLVTVYVPKPVVNPPMRKEVNNVSKEPEVVSPTTSKGKAIVPHKGSSMIPLACWNVRGLNRRDHQLAVSDLVDEFHLKLVGLLETRVAPSNVTYVQSCILHGWNWFVDPGGPGNRIWITWDNSEVNVDILATHDQFIHCRVHLLRSRTCSLVTFAYGVNDVYPRQLLWTHLVDLLDGVGDEPWIVLGDFNTVLDTREICGGTNTSHTAIDDFAEFIMNSGLVTLPSRGAIFTWHNCSDGPRSLWKKLDRMLVNDSWLQQWPNTACFNATPRTSDHSPIVLHSAVTHKDGRCFLYDNHLAKALGFIELVRSVWDHQIVGTPMYSITRKLKALKPLFRAKRKEKGDLTANVAQAKGFLDIIQQLMENDHSNDLLINLERMARLVLLRATRLEQSMLQQRAKIQWLKGGDQCSKIFFRKIAGRRAAQKIFQITDVQGVRISDEQGVAGEFIRFYTSLLGGQRRQNHINVSFLRSWARYVITTEDGQNMTRPVLREEVKEVFFLYCRGQGTGAGWVLGRVL
ncbi:UNVERIFIED_CONTAM: hypothetical protein Sradi_7092900 [Sesamum radiatum]|uniref:Endonuclease/exonuclease/phosphatase domain-containing protein n=1 Tax=Sesamum radiatum TaxID=300843 RepID=A0AAW2J371_SESRA